MELDEWTAAAVDPGEDVPDPDEWITVEVPGTHARFSGENAVAYRTHFSDPEGPRACLRLHGLYAHARVWLDGEHVGTHNTYFTPFETVFDPEERNELVVECRAPDDRFGGVFETPFVPPENSVPTIRWGASVEPVPEIALTDLTVRPDDTDEPGINAIVTVDTGTELDGRIRLSTHPAGEDGASALSQVGVTAGASERVTVQGRLSVRDPDRWWPCGVGPQHRYTVQAALGESERTATTGFRTVKQSREGLSVNGTRIPVRGRVALPAADPERATETIERAVETNATLVRLYGHAPPESVYDAAAEAGILLWQDVPMNPGALDVERSRQVARRLAGKYGHQPSLALFGVHDDAYAFDATTEEAGQRVHRATGGGERAASATAAEGALPDGVPTLAVPGLDSESEKAPNEPVIDGYAGSDTEFDAGAHTRYVIAGTDAAAATGAKRMIEERRMTGAGFVTVFAPPGAAAVEESIVTAFEPVGVFLDRTATHPEVVVVNDTRETISGELDWSAGRENGTLSVDIDPVSRKEVGRIDTGPNAATIELSLSLPDRRVENRYRS